MAKLAGRRSPDWALFERFEVPNYDEPQATYMTRWRIVQTPWFGIYVHRFDGPDPRPTLHDHPWDFVSLVLRGGYWERVPATTDPAVVRLNVFSACAINRKRAEDVHWITKLLRFPTWTLVFVGRRRREWGYLDRDGKWTRYDQHPHNAEFLRAMEARNR